MSAFLAAKRKEDLRHQEVLDDVVRMAYDNQVEGGHLGKRLIDGIKRPFEASVDGALKKSVNSSLGLLGNVTKGALKDDDMPEPVQVALLSFFETVWSQYSRTVEEEIFETQSLERAEHRRSLATQWAEWRWFWPSNSCCPQPWAWFRAVVLYHLMPADSSFWQVVRSPYFFAVALAQVVPFCAPRPAEPPHGPRLRAMPGGRLDAASGRRHRHLRLLHYLHHDQQDR